MVTTQVLVWGEYEAFKPCVQAKNKDVKQVVVVVV
jgi:hypothetical protein